MRPIDMRSDPRSREDGFALLVVLIVLMIVAIVATDLARRARIQSFLARNAVSDLAVEEAARGWTEVVMARLVYDLRQNNIDSEADAWADQALLQAEVGDVSLEVLVTDESGKFNLKRLMASDKDLRKKARDQFLRLLRSYRKDTDREVTQGTAEKLLEELVAYLERESSSDFPVPETGKDVPPILTVDELRYVKGFDDPDDPEAGLLYDVFREQTEDEMAAAEEVKPIPGLWQFVTLVSDGRININTAPVEVLRSLFKDEKDWELADAIIAQRTGQGTDYDADVDPEAEFTPFAKVEDLTKVEGITSKILSDNGIDASTVCVSSNVFSITVFATKDTLTRQFRTVVRRHAKGCITLLYEERKDPRYEPLPEEEDQGN